MPRPTPRLNHPMMDQHYSESYGEPYHNESYNGAYGRMPPLPRPAVASSRGGHYQEKAAPHAHHAPPLNFSSYAQSGTAPCGENSYPSHSSHSYGYDYFDKSGYTLPMSQHAHPRQAQQGPHPVDQSPPEDGDGVVRPPAAANHPPHPLTAAQGQLPRQGPSQPQANAAPKEVKKPPRPYTEYNIFFQLERERILGELEEEQRKKKEKQQIGTDDCDDTAAEGVNEGDNNGIDKAGKDPKNESYNESNTQNNKGDKANAAPKEQDAKEFEIIASKPGVPLNTPSDANDILPRPPRFAHLVLSPLWYDSTHRLAQSKLNKSRRKHRKTHGLVGFLDLTRRIAKAWSNVDPETKGYCKRVADRQLKIYKEELKMMKKKQSAINSGGDDGVLGAGGCAGGAPMPAAAQQQLMMRMRESAAAASSAAAAAVANGGGGSGRMPPPVSYGSSIRGSMGQGQGPPGQDMPPPPPPPPASQVSGAHPHHGSLNPEYGKYWLHQHPQHQQYPHHPSHQQHYPHHQTPHHRCGGHPSRPYYPPAIPPLTPTSEYMDERSGYYGGPPMHTPLDELMHRRKLYGTKSVLQGTSSRKRTATSGLGDGAKKEDTKAGGKLDQDSGNEAQHSKTYLSPADDGLSPNDTFRKSSSAAITPSPSRQHVVLNGGSSPPSSTPTSAGSENGPNANAASPGSLTPSQLPMKKRRKKLEEGEDAAQPPTDSSPNEDSGASSSLASPGSAAPEGGKAAKDSLPGSAGNGSASSPLFDLSPSGMMTPRDADMPPFSFGSSPLSGGSYRKALGPYLTGPDENSPFPYIDWGSPQEHGSSPRVGGGGGKGSSPQEAGVHAGSHRSVPPHLAVPGSYPHHPPPGPAGHPSSHYSHPGSHYPSHHPPAHHPPSHHHHPGSKYPPPPGYPTMPPSPYMAVDDFADEGVLDLDEEEMQLLWRKLATHAKRKRMRERDAAAAWMSYYGGGTSGSYGASPGGAPGAPGGGGHLRMTHSFSSPVERPEVVVRGGGGAGDEGGGKSAAAGPRLPVSAASGDDADNAVVVVEKKVEEV